MEDVSPESSPLFEEVDTVGIGEPEELEDINSDEDETILKLDDVSEGSPAAKKPKLPDKKSHSLASENLPLCEDCNLVFVNELSLELHTVSQNHKMVNAGMRPSTGTLHCFLCWKGFHNIGQLQDHYNSEGHEANVTKYKVKAIWMGTGHTGQAVSQDDNDLEDIQSDDDVDGIDDVGFDIPVIGMDASNEGLAMPDVVPKPATNVNCIPCNLVFKSSTYASRHLASRNHKAVISSRRPPAASGSAKYNCYLCWAGCSSRTDLMLHYKQSVHRKAMRTHGVADFIEDLTFDLAVRSVSDFIVVDEVGGDNEDILDMLENVDSPDEADEELATAPVRPTRVDTTRPIENCVPVTSSDEDTSETDAPP